MHPNRRGSMFVAVAILTILLLGMIGLALFYPFPGITEANAARIQAGMTLPDVEGILGGPAYDAWLVEGGELAKLWRGGAVGVLVYFDGNNMVTEASVDPDQRAWSPDLRDRLLSMLERLLN